MGACSLTEDCIGAISSNVPRSSTGTNSGSITLDQVLEFIYNPTEFSVTQPSFTTNGVEYKLPSNPKFQKSLGKVICILDIDTRPFTNENQIMYDGPFVWNGLERYSAGIMNHFTYGA